MARTAEDAAGTAKDAARMAKDAAEFFTKLVISQLMDSMSCNMAHEFIIWGSPREI